MNEDKILNGVKQFRDSILLNKEDILEIYRKNHNNPVKYWINVNSYKKDKNIIKRILNRKEQISYMVEITNKSKDTNPYNFIDNVDVSITNKSNGDIIKFILNTETSNDLEIKNFYTTTSNIITGAYEGDTKLIPLILDTAKYNLRPSLDKILKFVNIDQEAVKIV